MDCIRKNKSGKSRLYEVEYEERVDSSLGL